MKEATQCRTIAITSGKGGVGKSNVALNLAILLAAAGNRVALVDADLGMANLDVLLDLTVRGNLSHVIHGRKSIEEIILDLPNGVQLVPGASGLARVAEMGDLQRSRLEREMLKLEDDNDIILIDTGAGLNNHVVKFASAADNVMVVTTPEPTAMTDAYALTKVLHHSGYEGHLSMLVNMASGRHEARTTHQRIAGVARQFLNTTIYDAGYILEDARLRDAVRRREPVVLAYPRCPASKSLAALATKLCSGGALVSRKEGFFRRVANWFS
jgi:flagellar biosynthesis protein FlhG